jgi:hypothetical protein
MYECVRESVCVMCVCDVCVWFVCLCVCVCVWVVIGGAFFFFRWSNHIINIIKKLFFRRRKDSVIFPFFSFISFINLYSLLNPHLTNPFDLSLAHPRVAAANERILDYLALVKIRRNGHGSLNHFQTFWNHLEVLTNIDISMKLMK